MNAERWRKVEEICHAALETEEQERTALLDKVCAGDAELRREVESLLLYEHATNGFLSGQAMEVAAEALAGIQEEIRVSGNWIGKDVSHYRIVAEIGRGGMGIVYRAEDSRLNRPVALKFLPAEFLKDPQALERFKREAQTASSLDHSNICTVYDVGEHDGQPFIAMQYMEGQNLKERIASKPLTVDEVVDLGIEISDALNAAHSKGIVHRDIKPANIFVTRLGQAKIHDFGIAKLTFRGSVSEAGGVPTRSVPAPAGDLTGLTNLGAAIGTVAYMSPEQVRGENLDPRTDLFSFGTVLYEMATGVPPFQGSTKAALLNAILNDNPKPPSKSNPRIPAELDPIIDKALKKDKSLRYQTAAELQADLKRLHSQDGNRSSRMQWRYTWIFAALFMSVLAIGALLRLRGPVGSPDQSQWVQVTHLSDSATQPALSPDGRFLTFIRGPETFAGPGQIYIKQLPNGELVRLTEDNFTKMSPVFSPDGTRIAYTVVAAENHWDTWLVPITGGTPHRWLPNASGLVWHNKANILFSEIKDNDIHMAIVTADGNRRHEQDVYVPSDSRGMAHRSYPSPDGKWAVLVEMDRAVWLPCRLVPTDSSSPGRAVGPPGAGCTSSAWSPDGKWMYLNSSAGGSYHIWRQRFPDGQPEQITSGPTEEEGIAMAADGRSFITSVGLKQSSVWVHDALGERQVSLEGYCYDPKFTSDGRSLCYRTMKGTSPAISDPGELRLVKRDSGLNESLMPGFWIGQPADSYDISSDGRQVVLTQLDTQGKQELWVAPLDRHLPPRRIPNVEGQQPLFVPGGEIVFRAIEGASAFVYGVREDGTGLHKVIKQPIASLNGISPDGQWLVIKLPGSDGSSLTAFPLHGGHPVCIIAGGSASSAMLRVKWSADGRMIFFSFPSAVPSAMSTRRAYVVPLPPGKALPQIPVGGFKSDAEITRLPGAQIIDAFDVAPGPTPEVYAFSRQTMQRNLYRIPVR